MAVIKLRDKLYPEFIRLYNAGLNDHQIAKELGIVYPSTICDWRRRRGLPANINHRPSKTEPHADRIIGLRALGLYHREIADVIGVSESAVQKFLQRVVVSV